MSESFLALMLRRCGAGNESDDRLARYVFWLGNIDEFELSLASDDACTHSSD
ncbi:MAG: hypothetical protein ACRBK7_03665 [Acidimicrobiales bacterium]